MLGCLLILDKKNTSEKSICWIPSESETEVWKKKNFLGGQNQKGFLTPKHQWWGKAPATSEYLKWWQKYLKDIESAHNFEYVSVVEEEEEEEEEEL